MKIKHTPGPWQYVGGDNLSVEISVGKATAFVDRMEKNTSELIVEREEMEANGKLISAAPDMLSAMIEFCERVESGDVKSTYTYVKFKEIIKKATE